MPPMGMDEANDMLEAGQVLWGKQAALAQALIDLAAQAARSDGHGSMSCARQCCLAAAELLR